MIKLFVLGIVIVIILIFLYVILMILIYPKKKFKDKKYAQNESLLRFDYEEYFNSSQNFLILGFTTSISGFLAISTSIILFYLLAGFGIFSILCGITLYAFAQQRAEAIRDLLLNENQ